MTQVKRVLATNEATKLIQELKNTHGALMFHQSGGCCDGSSPMCYKAGQFKIGTNDVYLGDIEECPFYMSKSQFEYWQHTQLTIDVTKGRGASFSLEIPLGYRFMIRSRPFTQEESAKLTPVTDGQP
ncbi:DUF779 domain-containing protein [Caldalkalibacillus salinus]|uniref:DUF779 domain-containing protein n=1 Tax=Caldalkalibacillus salinus TaxID=2803787 RepID=UPI0019212516|nr:DUF779 domain-containing protein [Caldalkalibacillus salinus]